MDWLRDPDLLHMPLTDPFLIDKGVAGIATVIWHRALLQDALYQISMFDWEPTEDRFSAQTKTRASQLNIEIW